ncbi:hypothetical protein RI054_11g55580 [Pseudoscourfieldia marina]
MRAGKFASSISANGKHSWSSFLIVASASARPHYDYGVSAATFPWFARVAASNILARARRRVVLAAAYPNDPEYHVRELTPEMESSHAQLVQEHADAEPLKRDQQSRDLAQ